MWTMLSYIAWAIAILLGVWMLYDWYKIDSEYTEDVLTSSREGEIEAVQEKHQLKNVGGQS
ncbi:MAG: hypothetical protein U1E67_22525 [Hyphomicrobiales bacterium]